MVCIQDNTWFKSRYAVMAGTVLLPLDLGKGILWERQEVNKGIQSLLDDMQ